MGVPIPLPQITAKANLHTLPGAGGTPVSANGSFIDAGPFRYLTIQITGAWTAGSFLPSVYLTGTSSLVIPPILDVDGDPIGAITANGVYHIPLSGTVGWRIRADAIVGAATLDYTMHNGPLPERRKLKRTLPVLTGPILIAAGAAANLTADVSLYSIYSAWQAYIRADVVVPFLLRYEPRGDVTAYGQSESHITVLETTHRGRTDKIDVRSAAIRVSVVNQSSTTAANFSLGLEGWLL